MRHARHAVLLLLGALAAGCTQPAAPKKADAAEAPAVVTEPADAPTGDTQATYTCDNGVKLAVTFLESGNARVKAGDMAEMELPGVVSASGNRFSNGRYELWTKGMDEALWTVGRAEPAHCTAP